MFSGVSGPYTERDEPRSVPLSAYGQSKLRGEHAVLQADPRAVVVRTTTLYGPEARGNNFAYRLAADAKATRVTRVPNDQVSTPTYNRDLGEFVRKLTNTDPRGVIHFSGDELMNRVEFAERLAQAGGLHVRLDPVPTDYSSSSRSDRSLAVFDRSLASVAVAWWMRSAIGSHTHEGGRGHRPGHRPCVYHPFVTRDGSKPYAVCSSEAAVTIEADYNDTSIPLELAINRGNVAVSQD